MQIHVVDVGSGAHRHSFALGNKPLWLGLERDAGNQLRWTRAAKYRLQLSRKGRNVIVTDHGSPFPVSVNGQNLQTRTSHIWLENQDLSIADRYLLRWEYEASDTPVSAFWPLFALMTVLLLVLLWSWIPRVKSFFTGIVMAPSAVPSTALTQITTPMPSPAPSPAPTPTAQPLPAIMPTQVRVAPQDAVPGSQPASTAAAVAGISVTPTPVPCATAPVRSDDWDTHLTMDVAPVCVRPGEQYYQLVEARWLDGPEFAGYHHLFVDVVDEARNRLNGASFVMAWQDGLCRRYIRNLKEPIDHGEHCPMFAAGPAYSARVEGLPSEVARNLGLGTVNPLGGEERFLTSYYLLFQRAQYPEK